MSHIGERLRAAREAKGLTLEQAEQATRIRAKFLEALEADDVSGMASPAQARGFIRNYAEFLGLEAEALLAGFAPSTKAAKPRFSAPTPEPDARPARRAPSPEPARPAAPASLAKPSVGGQVRRALSPDFLITLLVIVLVGALAAWGGAQLLSPLAEPETATAPVGGLGTATPSALEATSTPELAEAQPTESLPTPLPNYVGVNLLVRAEQRTWLRVLVDGVETFVGLMAPGEMREFVGQQTVELWTGNGRGTRVVFNGNDQGTLGGFGAAVIRLWTLNGMVTPTPTTAP
jgi:cytoskeletal protein RodZ